MVKTLEDLHAKCTVDLETGCIVWNLHKAWWGHGQLKLGGKVKHTHRVAYELAYGGIPEGAVVRHICDNPPCCNPEHLLIGTHNDNVQDRCSRGRSARGLRHGRTKLSENDVRNIRQLDFDKLTYAEVGRQYGVDGAAIRSIRIGKTWKHLV